MDTGSLKYFDVITRRGDVRLAHKTWETRRRLCPDLPLPTSSAFSPKTVRMSSNDVGGTDGLGMDYTLSTYPFRSQRRAGQCRSGGSSCIVALIMPPATPNIYKGLRLSVGWEAALFPDRHQRNWSCHSAQLLFFPSWGYGRYALWHGPSYTRTKMTSTNKFKLKLIKAKKTMQSVSWSKGIESAGRKVAHCHSAQLQTVGSAWGGMGCLEKSNGPSVSLFGTLSRDETHLHTQIRHRWQLP